MPNMNDQNSSEVSNSNTEKSAKSFSIELKTNPQTVEANKETELTFSIKDKNGAQVKDFTVIHEKKMHLIIVSSDLAEFEHIHPEIQTDGSFKIKYTFKHGGNFILYSDVTPENGSNTVERIELAVNGNEKQLEKLIVDNNLTKSLDGVSVKSLETIIKCIFFS